MRAYDIIYFQVLAFVYPISQYNCVNRKITTCAFRATSFNLLALTITEIVIPNKQSSECIELQWKVDGRWMLEM